MSVCKSCYATFPHHELDTEGFCATCAAERARMRENLGLPEVGTEVYGATRKPTQAPRHLLAQSITLSTEGAAPDLRFERLGMVSSEMIIGVNLISDLRTEVRDLWGGQSRAGRKALKETKEAVLQELREEAADIGANMVIAVSIQFSPYGPKQSALLAYAQGTAIQVRTPLSESEETR
ncbi:heavy metal-binding domain-containing protein [Ferrimonas balearica]|nr:heavy metal-binding domain-containing protein [Ferrimonas balearica]